MNKVKTTEWKNFSKAVDIFGDGDIVETVNYLMHRIERSDKENDRLREYEAYYTINDIKRIIENLYIDIVKRRMANPECENDDAENILKIMILCFKSVLDPNKFEELLGNRFLKDKYGAIHTASSRNYSAHYISSGVDDLTPLEKTEFSLLKS